MRYKHEFIGEALGTFVLVLFGCGAVAVNVLFGAYSGILQIAIVWGVGVALAIYLTRNISCAHLNPAVTLAMVISKRMKAKKLPAYIIGQLTGAFVAGIYIYVLFGSSISAYENAHSILRGSPESIATARIFGDFYSSTDATAVVSLPLAIGAEAFGTFLLVVLIFALTEGCNIGRPENAMAPFFIGLSVTSIICLIGPLTQAGLNPARDLGTRMVAWLFGWKNAAFPDNMGGFFLVYILGPLVGGSIASLFFGKILEPAMKSPSDRRDCCE